MSHGGRSQEVPGHLSLVSGVTALRAATLRGTEGFFRAGQDDSGKWWLLDPAGEPFFCQAVHDVRATAPHGDGALPIDSAARLRAWGFNAVGVGAESAGRDDGMAFMASAEFGRVGAMLAAPGLRLPDVFDSEWPRLAMERATEVCAPLASERQLLGWVTDDGLAWTPPSLAGRPSLLQACLSLEPSFAAYHAAWEFVLALHGGRLESVAQAWNAALRNKETLRELTRAEEGLSTRGYLRDDARWTREFARRYFTATSAAIRAADPNHLVLGCRSRGPLGAHVIAECVYPAVDVALVEWSELSSAAAGVSPVIASDVAWAHDEFYRLTGKTRSVRLTSVERMLKRARAALDRLARHPAVVGYAWAQWQDEPGEQPPFARGLVHVNGAEAREHTEVLASFNHRAKTLRRAPNSSASHDSASMPPLRRPA